MLSIEEKLRIAGLTGNETKVYLTLIKSGELNGNEIAKETGLDRSLCYTILNNLLEKGLVHYIIKEKLRHFSATDPENLLTPIKQKEELISQLIPELKSVEKIKPAHHKVNVYEGKKGLRVLFQKLKHIKKEAVFFGGTGRSYDVLKWETEHFEKILSEKNITIRGTMSKEASKNNRMEKVPGIKIRILDKVESDATTTIGDDFVGIHILTGKPFVTIIESKEIAEGYRNYFEFIWKNAKPLNSNK